MTTKRDPEATRHALLEAAETVFLEKGFGNTALSEIARRAGVTKSLIHHHFGSKESLWQVVKQRRIDEYAGEQLAMLETSAPSDDLLKNSIELYFRFLKKNPQIVRILAWMFVERETGDCPMKHDELIQAGLRQIRAGQDAGILRADIDARFMLFTFLGIAQHWFQDRDHFIHDFGTEGLDGDLDEIYLAAMVNIFLGGVLADKNA
jgi:TetR/AcrR family transcriptional regulator